MIEISEAATQKIKDMLTQEELPGLFLRLGVREGGCSGFSYGMGFDNNRTEQDQEYAVNGLKVVVDENSARFLDGVKIDYETSGMDGGFTIDNPNAVATCGCGSSFRTKQEAGKAEEC